MSISIGAARILLNARRPVIQVWRRAIPIIIGSTIVVIPIAVSGQEDAVVIDTADRPYTGNTVNILRHERTILNEFLCLVDGRHGEEATHVHVGNIILAIGDIHAHIDITVGRTIVQRIVTRIIGTSTWLQLGCRGLTPQIEVTLLSRLAGTKVGISP